MARKVRSVSRKSMQKVLARSRAHSSQYATLRIAPDVHSETAVSFVISKKAELRAVKRNLLKRRGGAIVRSFLSEKPPYKPFSAVFFMKKGASNLSYQALKEEIEGLLARA